MKKTIGVITFDFYPFIGGIGRHVYETYFQALKEKNEFNIKIISPSKVKFKDCINIFSFVKLKKFFGENISFSILISPLINYLIKKHKIDILNIQTGPGGIFLFFKPKIKTIATAHHTYYQQSLYIDEQWWKKIFIFFEKRTYQLVDEIMVDTESTRKVLIENYWINPKKIEVVSILIDTNRFKNLNKKKIDKSLFFVGRLEKRKGIDLLVESIPEIKKNIPGIKLFIAGKGNLEPQINEFIKKNKLKQNIFLLGRISDEDLIDWYNKVKIVVVPSVFEGFGLTAVEAMSCGTPTIASNTDGLKDVLSFCKKNLFEFKNKNDLLRAIKLNLNRDYIKKIKTLMDQQIELKYSIKNNLNKVCAKYET